MKRKRRKAVSKKQKESTFTDWALLGSVIVNILQATNQATTTQDLNVARRALQRIRVERKKLIYNLNQWRKVYLSLRDKADKLEHKFIELKNAISKQNEDLYKLQQEEIAVEEKNEKLKAENRLLVKELKNLKKKSR